MLPPWILALLIPVCLVLLGTAYILILHLIPTPIPTAAPTSTATLTPTPEPGAPIIHVWCIYPSDNPPEDLKACQLQVIIKKGQKITVKWQVSNADGVQITHLGDQPNTAQQDYLPLEATDFTLKAYYIWKITQRHERSSDHTSDR
jgi:hypothetical protein